MSFSPNKISSKTIDKNIRCFLERLLRIKGPILLVTHRHADPDGLSALFGLKEILLSLSTTSTPIIFIKTLKDVSKRLLNHFNLMNEITTEQDIHIENIELIIVVDTPTLEILDMSVPTDEKMPPLIIIDHHQKTKEILEYWERKKYQLLCWWQDSTFHATAEMVTTLGKELNVKFRDKTATLLLSGIIYDTGRFSRMSKNLMECVLYLLDCNASYNEITALFTAESVDNSEKIAVFKALQRLILEKIGSYVFVGSYVGAYEAKVANILVMLGADVAMVYSEKKNEIRVSYRANSTFSRETGVSLGKDLVPQILQELGGSGGGHSGAAGINVPKSSDLTFDYVFKLTKKILERTMKKNE